MATRDIRDYGARVDGSTDDTDAVASAIAAASAGDTILFPSGTTKVYAAGGAAIELDDSIPSDLTLAGAGESTVLKMGARSADRNAWVVGVRGNGNPIRGLTIRDLVLDGNRANNPEYTSSGFNLYPGGYGHDITIRDVRAQNCSDSGVTIQGGTVVVENATAVNNHRQGFGMRLSQATADPAVYLRDVVAENNDSVGIDHHGGVAVVDGFWTENNGNGGAKVTEESHESTWRNGTIKANGTMGFRYNDGRGDYPKFPVHLDNVVARDNPWAGFWLSGDVLYDVGTIAAVRNNTTGRQHSNIDILGAADVDGDVVYSSDANGYGLFYDSTSQSQIGTYGYTGNDNGPLSGPRTSNLAVQGTSGNVQALAVPSKDDIGAWATHTTVSSGSSLRISGGSLQMNGGSLDLQ